MSAFNASITFKEEHQAAFRFNEKLYAPFAFKEKLYAPLDFNEKLYAPSPSVLRFFRGLSSSSSQSSTKSSL